MLTMNDVSIYNSNQLIARAVELANHGRKRRIAVAAAQDADVIGAVAEAQDEGFIEGLLFGDADEIAKLATERDIDPTKLTIVHEPDPQVAAQKAVELAAEGKADGIMKGFISTSALLKLVLSRQYGLIGKNTLSHCAVLDIPEYDRLLTVTDGGMILRPSSDQKVQILENAVLVSRALGIDPVRVAVSAAADQVAETMDHTVADRDEVIPKALARLDHVVIQGPMSLESAVGSGYRSTDSTDDVAGSADIYLVNSIEEGNIVSKALVQFAGAVFAGVIVGARVPVSLVSRTDSMKNKKASLALACLIAYYYEKENIWNADQ